MADDKAHARHDIGVCAILQAEAVGPPGQRRFRLRASGEHGSVLLWLEKEELSELALTVKRMLRTPVKPAFAATTLIADDETRPDFEAQVTRLALGYDRTADRYMLLAQLSDDEDDAIVLWAERDLLDRMADQAFEVRDAGRPRCPLCAALLQEGRRHVCPRAN
jgi:uncharacterized repeat protein (TIGR03847 family)